VTGTRDTGIAQALERARAINAVLRQIANGNDLVVGFPSLAVIPDAYAALGRLGLKDRWYESAKEWTRRTIVSERRAYEYLWPHVELELVIGGRVQVFLGNGMRKRADSPVHAVLAARLPPVYWQIVPQGPVDQLRGLVDDEIRSLRT